MAKTDATVQLTGEDGNAYAILGKVSKALRRNDHADLVDEFMKDAMSGDYDHLLQTAMAYVNLDRCGFCMGAYVRNVRPEHGLTRISQEHIQTNVAIGSGAKNE